MPLPNSRKRNCSLCELCFMGVRQTHRIQTTLHRDFSEHASGFLRMQSMPWIMRERLEVDRTVACYGYAGFAKIYLL